MKQSQSYSTKKLVSHFIPDAKLLSGNGNYENELMEVYYSERNNWLVAIKKNAPFTEKEIITQRKMNTQQEIVFISAFKSTKDFQKHCDLIPWKTHVWIAETPEHMIHFNGDRFMGPR